MESKFYDQEQEIINNSFYASSIEASFQPLDIAFHPTLNNLIASSLVDGSLEVHDIRKDEDEDEYESLLSSLSLHENGKGSCKCVAFSVDGTKIYTGGSHGDLCAVDAERACTFSTLDGNNNNPLWRIHGDENIKQDIVAQDDTTNKHNALVIVYPFRKDGEGASMLATGDDNGSVRIFDERLCGGGSTQNSTKRPKGCVLEWNQHTDYVSGIEYSPYGTGNSTLLATSADGTLGVYDLRMNKGSVVDTSRTSDHQDDELLSLCILKSGKKSCVRYTNGVPFCF